MELFCPICGSDEINTYVKYVECSTCGWQGSQDDLTDVGVGDEVTLEDCFDDQEEEDYDEYGT